LHWSTLYAIHSRGQKICNPNSQQENEESTEDEESKWMKTRDTGSKPMVEENKKLDPQTALLSQFHQNMKGVHCQAQQEKRW